MANFSFATAQTASILQKGALICNVEEKPKIIFVLKNKNTYYHVKGSNYLKVTQFGERYFQLIASFKFEMCNV